MEGTGIYRRPLDLYSAHEANHFVNVAIAVRKSDFVWCLIILDPTEAEEEYLLLTIHHAGIYHVCSMGAAVSHAALFSAVFVLNSTGEVLLSSAGRLGMPTLALSRPKTGACR